MHTKVMRSVSSEDIRSEARRAIRTREGKDCHQDIVLLGQRRYQRTTGVWCRWVHSFGFVLGGQIRIRYVAVTSTTSNDSVRDSLPDKIEKLPFSFLAELSGP